MAKRIAILIFDAFSLVEVSSIAEVFRLANEIDIERGTAVSEPSHPPSAPSGQGPPLQPTLAPQPSPPPARSGLPPSHESHWPDRPPPSHHPHLSRESNAAPQFEPTHEPYGLVVVSDGGGSVASSGAMRVWSAPLEDYVSHGFDVLFIAGGPGAARAKTDQTFLRHVRTLLQKTRIVKPIGEGFAILAATNALAEHPEAGAGPSVPLATVAAARTSPLLEQPVSLDDPLGPIAAALSIVKRDRGADAAREISERSIPGAWRRLGAVLGELDEGGAREKIAAAARWMRENYGQPISVAKAAQVAAMSERSFLRRFKSQMGLTPSEYLLRARLDASCLLLVATDLPVDKIARRCGVSSGDGLAKIFRKRLAISPTEYRIAERRRASQH